ncbi:MAG: nucleotidyltransferase family protein [Pseudomonadota bacterium]
MMTETAFVILAAGLSRRMCTRNKLLLEIGGRPLVRGVAEACLATKRGAVCVVLGHERAAVERALEGLDIRRIANPAFAEGQMTSVAAGLSAVPEGAHTVLALGDQPRLGATALDALIDAHFSTSDGRITVPVRGDDRGNPIVIPPALRETILAGDAKLGCRHLTRRRPDLVAPFATDDPAYFVDIDTPDDVKRERALAAAEAA